MEHAGRQLDWTIDPLEALRRWPAERRVLMLHSGRLHERWSRWTLLTEPVGTWRFADNDARGGTGVSPVRDGAGDETATAGNTPVPPRVGKSNWIGDAAHCPVDFKQFTHRPFTDLRALLRAGRDGFWVGYLSYDLGRWIERLPSDAVDDRGWPVAELGYCPGYLAYDHLTRRWLACGRWSTAGYPALNDALPQLGEYTAGEPRSGFTQADYEQTVARAIEYIAAGDVFQVNIAQRFTAALTGDYPLAHRALFHRLATLSPAWYGAYLELPSDHANDPSAPGRVIASTSPELFLEVDAQGNVVTRPIKGTRPAYTDPRELRRSEKDQAELHMIVDLLRNDLGRVCEYGSVRVDEARAIESHPTVHHGVATITGRLHRGKDIVDLLRAAIPGGSITGAPKVRAMQIIDELEPVRRGPYCGCIGLLAADRACLNIAIRTMLADPRHERIDFSVGGGIVADSTPRREFDETIDKAQAMMQALRLEREDAVGQTFSLPRNRPSVRQPSAD